MPAEPQANSAQEPGPSPSSSGDLAEVMARLLRESLDRQGYGWVAASVHTLGRKDAFAQGVEGVGFRSTAAEQRETAVPVHLYGHHAIVGPQAASAAAGSEGSPCVHCFTRRWQAVRSVSLREGLELGGVTHEVGTWPYALEFSADALAAVVAQVHARPQQDLFSDIHLVDLDTLEVRRYPLVADPQCPVCANPASDTPEGAVVTLNPAFKHADGAFRVRGIEAYGIDVTAFANPVCGALGPSVVHDVSSTSTSATIGCFSMRSGSYLRETFWGGHASSFAVSTRIGILEGLERYAGMQARGKRTTVTGTLEDFAPQAIDPRAVGLYSESFYQENPHVRPFATDRPIPWVWGYSLRDQVSKLVPEVLTYYHAPGLENRFVQESSNGCASGGCPEEAVYFGLMEVVERDAFLLSWYGKQPLPEIAASTSRRPATRQMVDRLEMYGYRARFFDARISFPIPVIAAVAERMDGGAGRLCFGAGAGLDPESALDAALCEIATDAVNLRERTERDEERLRRMAADFSRVTALHDHPLLYGLPEMAHHADFLLRDNKQSLRSVSDLEWPTPSGAVASEDLAEDLERCVDALAAAGFDVVVVDQTLPEQRAMGLHTFSVLVPGLLPIDFGWARQRALGMPRMRSAFREAGLREHDLRTCEMNPAPHPFP
ncbi:TOMM precursor leader peptide-binding protein [Streptomyces rubiginosohelvolus]|uniref:TOMM precursor leader peptide-binding protein n=1 Tax=Streptomyces rubiginosohelvolus TaxID=67362 RepID=UPI00371C60EF